IQTAAHCIQDTDPDCGPFAGITGGPSTCSAAADPTGDGTSRLDPDDIVITLGVTTHSTATTADTIAVQKIRKDTNYDPVTTDADFAWITLSSPAPLGANVKTIQVPGPGEGSVWDANSPAVVSGWGDTCDQCNLPADTLKAAVVPIISQSD